MSFCVSSEYYLIDKMMYLNQSFFQLIEKNFDFNTSFYQSNNLLRKYKMTSNDFFKKNDKYFDLIYVDGDHSSDQVKIDLINSWNALKNGGFLVLDDYMCGTIKI